MSALIVPLFLSSFLQTQPMPAPFQFPPPKRGNVVLMRFGKPASTLDVFKPAPEDTRSEFAFPYWHIFASRRNHRLPESFFLRNRVRAALLEGPTEKSLQQAKRALELSPASTDAQFLDACMRTLLEDEPVTASFRQSDARQFFLRFFDAYRYGDLEQALVLVNSLNLAIQERFLLFLHIGNQLVRDGVLADAQTLLHRALESLELNHASFFGMRGTVKRDLYRFIVTSLAEIRFKSGDFRTAFGFLQWLGQGDFMAAQDPIACRWDELLKRRCKAPDPLSVQLENLPWYTGDAERLAFHEALWIWGEKWENGASAMAAFLEKHPQTVWNATVQDFRKWVQSNPRP